MPLAKNWTPNKQNPKQRKTIQTKDDDAKSKTDPRIQQISCQENNHRYWRSVGMKNED